MPLSLQLHKAERPATLCTLSGIRMVLAWRWAGGTEWQEHGWVGEGLPGADNVGLLVSASGLHRSIQFVKIP